MTLSQAAATCSGPHAAESQLTAAEFNEVEQLSQYRRVWSELLAQTAGATFLQSLEWLEVYWRHYGPNQTLRVVIVSCDGRPIGILPLVERCETTRLGQVRVLTYAFDDWGSFYGPIGPHPAATLVAGMRHLRESQQQWDTIDLRAIHGEQDHGRTQRAMRLNGFAPATSHWMTAAIVDLCGGWDAYWSSRKSHWRNNVRRCEKKLQERGKLTYIRYRPRGRARGDGAPRWDLYNACEQLAQNSWQASSTSGTTLSHNEVRAFFRDAHARAAEAGFLDLNLLLVDDVPAAFSYNYHFQGQVTGLRMGFDHAVAREGAGIVLQYLSLKDSCQRGDRLLDMGTEYLDCKRYWHTHLVETRRCTHYAPLSFRGQALRIKRGLQGLWDGNRNGKAAGRVGELPKEQAD